MFRITAAQTGPNEFAISVADVEATRFKGDLTREQVEQQFQIPAVLLRLNAQDSEDDLPVPSDHAMIRSDIQIMGTIHELLEGLTF